MSWNRYYTSAIDSVTFIAGELSYYGALLITAKLSGKKESYATYLDRKNKVLSEHTLTEENKEKGEIGYKFFTNKKKVKKYIESTLKIIDKVDKLKREVDSLSINELDGKQFFKLVKKTEFLYDKSMGYYFLSQPEYTAKLNKLLLAELGKYIPSDKLQKSFFILIKSIKPTCLEVERRDWLRNILIPLKNGKVDSKEKDRLIKCHVGLYKYLPASSQFGLWDKDHYKKLIHSELKKEIVNFVRELKEIENRGQETEKNQKKIITQHHLPANLMEKIETVRVLSWLRLEAHLKGWAFLLYLGPLLVLRTAEIFNLPSEDVFNLTSKEFTKLLKGKLKLTKEHRKRRDGNILAIITPKKRYEVFWAEEAEKKYNSELAEVMPSGAEFTGQTASGSGKIVGRVVVFKWGKGDINKKIYAFPKGQILVAGQTMPQFMPAIRKAKAIITNEGGMLCHAAIVSRELKIPAIIGTKNATEILKDGDLVEMDVDKGIVKIIKN
jgi:phosphohistidine swiveling domain-containing protein